MPVWETQEGAMAMGPIEWVRARFRDKPIRADRSRLLADEPGGRLDRLDIWVLVILVISLLTVRIWRLSEPYGMHFDEVYHARTATEFLQDWRYGISHDIYEWTHPPRREIRHGGWPRPVGRGQRAVHERARHDGCGRGHPIHKIDATDGVLHCAGSGCRIDAINDCRDFAIFVANDSR